MKKSGKSTVSFTYLGKSYRFFAEIRRVLTRVLSPNFASLKTPPCLSKTAQTWREKPANSSDMVCFSGKSFRLGEIIRLASGAPPARPELIPARAERTDRLARNPVHSQHFRTRNPVSTRNGYRVEIACNLCTHAALTCSVAVAALAPYLKYSTPPSMRGWNWSPAVSSGMFL